jgi:hypothetical protein
MDVAAHRSMPMLKGRDEVRVGAGGLRQAEIEREMRLDGIN